MEFVLSKFYTKDFLKSSIFNFAAVLFIFFVPALSHLTALPIYLIEPMRLAVILAVVHTSKRNAFIVALTLPIFSFLVSAHPVFIKSFLIMAELILNVALFFFIKEKIKNDFISMLFSISISKTFYYTVKLVLINSLLINGDLISTPIYIQLITMMFYSLYLLIGRKKEVK